MTSSISSFRAPGTFGCEFCPQALPTKGSLNRHRNTHIRPYKCVTCQSGFALRSDLRRHEGKHGSVDPRYMCKWPQCVFKGSTRKDNLMRHMKKMHSKVVTGDEEDTCNATVLRDAYDEAVENRKESEKSLTILKLVQGGNVTSLKLLLHGGENVTETTDSGRTALHVAAINGHLDILKLLLDTKIKHNAKDTAGRSALHDAARGGHFHIFQELIAAGLSLSDRDKNDEDPLCDACRNGHRDLVQEMLGIQTQLALSDGSPIGFTPSERSSITQSTSDEYHYWVKTVGLKKYIKLAIENGHRAITEIILVQHSDIKQKHLAYALEKAAGIGEHQLVVSILKQKDRLSLGACFRAISLAAMCKDTPTMNTLFEEAIRPKIGADMEELHILLLQAISSGNNALVRFLVGKGANPNHQSGTHRMTPLCKASSRGQLTIVDTLLEAGACVDILASFGTALYMAIRQGRKEVVALLLEAGANPNVFAKSCSNTALQEAVQRGDKAIIDLLIQNGADINALSNSRSGTALQEAVKTGDKVIIDLLIEMGAEINASADTRSGTALQEAVRRANNSVIMQLLQLGADANAPAIQGSGWCDNPGLAIQVAVETGNQTILDMLLLAGADFKVPANATCGTPLQEAVRNGNESMVKQLIDLGADVNAPRKEGGKWNPNPGLPIQEAVKTGNQRIVDMLLLAGVDFSVPANADCGTPLQEAVRNDNEFMVKQLIDLGVDIDALAVHSSKNYSGYNSNPKIAIQEAIKRGNWIIVDMLLLAGADAKVPANKYCGTPLQEAVRNGNEYMVRQLIDLGVDVNASAVDSKVYSWGRNRNPESAIQEAIKGRNQAIVDMLIRAGAVQPREG
ncbi:hypothetical protein EAE96_005521 [Botrytis aclada]|nr:hypothetical protein EAE96_005521 [Botrytis aclada]